MKLSQLRIVLAVAECGGLRAAGRELNIPQPLITRSIREIEHELDATLFERHARGVRLTAIGSAFVRRAMNVQMELQRARDEVTQLKGGTTGQVAVALSTASSIAILPRMLPAFLARYPGGVLKVTEGLFQVVEQRLLDGDIDFYVGPFDTSHVADQLTVELVFEHRRFIVGRRGHPLATATSLAELASARWIRPALSIRRSEADFDGMLRDIGIVDARIVMHAHSMLSTFIALIHSDLLTVIPQQWLEFEPVSAYLTRLEGLASAAAAPVCIVRRGDIPPTPMAEFLSDLIRRVGRGYARRIALEADRD